MMTRIGYILLILLVSLVTAAGCRSYGPSAGAKLSSFSGVRTESRDERGLLSDSASERIWSIQRFASRGRTDMAHQIALLIDRNHEPAPQVRAAAAVAAGRLGTAQIAPLVARGLDDPDAVVRMKSAMALGKLGAAGYADVLRDMMMSESESPEARIEAALALGRVGEMDVAPALIDTLGGLNDSLALASYRSLTRLTDVDFGMDSLLWQSWWDER